VTVGTALERDLEQIAAESRHVKANGLSHHVLDYGGDGPDVLVLPGITSPAISWDFVAERLKDDARLIVVDVRGRGLSDQPASGYSLGDYAADTAGVIEALGLDRPILLGHSMGARIAAATAFERPELAGPLVLVDPPLSGPGRGPYPTSWDAFKQQLRESYRGTTADEVGGHYPSWPERERELRARWLPTCAEGAIAETHRGFETDDFFDHWPYLKAPLALIYGGASPVVSADGAAELRATNADAELVCVDGAGHMIPWDRFDAFIDAVGPLIGRFGRTGA
jgi:N-formylmaleamate deformylase